MSTRSVAIWTIKSSILADKLSISSCCSQNISGQKHRWCDNTKITNEMKITVSVVSQIPTGNRKDEQT